MRAVLTMAMLVATPAVAAPPDWAGVWHGPAGTLCLRSSDAYLAAYVNGAEGLFYDAARRPVRVIGASAAGGLVEEPQLPEKAIAWRDLRVSGYRLNAVRGGQPLALTRVPLRGDDDAPCGDPAFTTALLPKAKQMQRRREVGGVGYDAIEVSFGPRFFESTIGTFSVLGSSPAVVRLNTQLKNAVSGPVVASEFWSCMTSAWSVANIHGYQSENAEPEAIAPRLVAWRTSYGFYCGGAHPYWGVSWIVHDLTRGADIDPWRWFVPAAAADGKPAGRLRSLLVTAWAAKIRAKEFDADCADIGTDNNWSPHVVAAGVAFAPVVAYALSACIDDVVISWPEVLPLLSEAGQTDLAELRQALSVRPQPP